MKVTVLHLDLGIGGAERLVVNTCCALQELGHDFTVLTSHHDKNHCFEETKPGGRLHPHIRVYGDWLPRHFLGRGTALFSVLRMIYLALVVVLIHLWQRPKKHVVFIDGVSAPIPILKLVGIKVLFYCHFPDKLLVKDYGGPIKRSYRFVLDAIEENTTGCADVVAVNSTFTAEEFRRAFRLLLLYNCGTEIMNPTVERAIMVDDYLERKQTKSRQLIEYTEGTDFVFVSINRFEREKHIELAIGALRFLKDRVAVNYKSRKVTVKLVVAGGYDPQVQENREYLEELRHVARKLEVEDDVVFRTSIGQDERFALLSVASALLYTPAREHFGIVPIEAMSMGTPVVAVASAGPLETISDGHTGFLCAQTPVDFSNNMMRFIIDPQLSLNMARTCRSHVEQHFTPDILKIKLERLLVRCADNEDSRVRTSYFLRKCLFGVASVGLVAALFAFRALVFFKGGSVARVESKSSNRMVFLYWGGEGKKQ